MAGRVRPAGCERRLFMTYVALVSRCFIGVVFAVSAFAKLRSAGLVVAAAVLAAFTAGTFMAARSQAGAVPCQCFGPSSVPLGMPHAARNALLCAAAAVGAAGVGPVAAHLPVMALSLGIGAAAALPAIFLDDLIALYAGGGTASPAAPTRRAASLLGDGKVRS